MTGLAQSLITIVLFALILGVLVVIHELGHFVTARLARVRVLEFGIGFPPRARVLRNRGETLYTLNWLPIGGFVKLEGEDGNDAADPRSFAAQPLVTKLLILLAGVAMNVVLSFAIFSGIALGGDPTIGFRIGTVQAGSPAAAAGLTAGDVVASLDGRYRGAFDGISLLDDLRASAGKTVRLGVERVDGSLDEVTVTLRSAAQIDADHGALGIERPAPATTRGSIRYTVGDALRLGAQRTVDALGLIVDGLGQLGDSIVNRPTEPPPVAGPVGIATQIGDIFWQLGPVITLYVAGILSANLAVVNILPFPPLDGGRMLVITLKRVFGERISLRAERLTYVVGFIFLFAFIIWVTGFDIMRSLGGAGS
jgi:regulator of sigma E protease